jgi:hypothetical protein
MAYIGDNYNNLIQSMEEKALLISSMEKLIKYPPRNAATS